MKRDVVTADHLREVLGYDPLTGLFTWRQSLRGPRSAGRLAGCVDRKGYIVICIDGVSCMAHRLAFLYMTGEWPDALVDHVDGVKGNNRWANLRASDSVLNAQNRRKPRSGNTAGALGVSWHKRRRRFRAEITVSGRCHWLGWFKDREEAAAAYLSAKRRLHESCSI